MDEKRRERTHDKTRKEKLGIGVWGKKRDGEKINPSFPI